MTPIITHGEYAPILYADIRAWYQSQPSSGAAESDRLVRALPEGRTLTKLEMALIFTAVKEGVLHWGADSMWNGSTMASRADTGLHCLDVDADWLGDHNDELRSSRLYPYLHRPAPHHSTADGIFSSKKARAQARDQSGANAGAHGQQLADPTTEPRSSAQ